MADEIELMQIVERIYDAATDATRFRHLAKDIAQAFDAESAWLYTVVTPGPINKDMLSATANFDTWAHTTYTNYYRQQDDISRRLLKRPKSQVALRGELMGDGELLRTEFYSDYLRKVGMHEFATSYFPMSGIELGAINIHRSRNSFGERDRALLQMLIPHVRRAYQIYQRLGAAEIDRALTINMLERLTFGAFVVDGNCRLLFANQIARRLLEDADGVALVRGRLRPLDSVLHAKLDHLVREVAKTSAGKGMNHGGVVFVPRPTGAPLSLLISPFRAAAAEGGSELPAALVVFADPSAHGRISEQAMASAFGLAPAEARLLCALAAGRSLADHAEATGTTMNTVRTQLRQVFHKTGINRQADLVRAVLSDPVIKLAGDPEPDASK
jgi:DNA-binding CsgD family transcriptional regulator